MSPFPARAGDTPRLALLEAEVDGVGGVGGLADPRSVAVSPDGKHVYVASLGDTVAVFARNEGTGALDFVQFQADNLSGVDGLDGAIAVAVSPDGGHVYVASLYEQAVTAFERNATTGSLAFVETHKQGDPGISGLAGASSLALSPDGHHVYVASRSPGDSVAVFSRNATTGALTFVEALFDGGMDSMSNPIDGLGAAFGIAVSPDGKHVYTASIGDDAVAAFSRDAVTGVLTFIEVQTDTDPGVDGLNGAASLALSPDGRHVYVASFSDHAVAAFSRDGATGMLDFLEVHKNLVGGVDGLDNAISVVVSPNGASVFVASQDPCGGATPCDYAGNSVVVFSRTAGPLTFVDFYEDGTGPVDGIHDPQGIAVSPDGKNLYLASSADQAVGVFLVSVVEYFRAEAPAQPLPIGEPLAASGQGAGSRVLRSPALRSSEP